MLDLQAFPGVFCTASPSPPRRVLGHPGRKKRAPTAADAPARFYLKIVDNVRAVSFQNRPFPVENTGFPASPRSIPPYPAFLNYVVSLQSLWISHVLYRSHQDFLSSIFANIFAGLVTGLIICLLSGVKQFYIAKLKNKKNWLEHIRTMVSDYIDLYHKLTEKQFTTFDATEELFDFIYDVGSHANWINGKRPPPPNMDGGGLFISYLAGHRARYPVDR